MHPPPTIVPPPAQSLLFGKHATCVADGVQRLDGFFLLRGVHDDNLGERPGRCRRLDVENHRALELSRRRRHEHVLKLPQTIVRLAGVEEERLAVSALALALALANDDALEPRGWDATRSALVREQVELDRNHLCADFALFRESSRTLLLLFNTTRAHRFRALRGAVLATFTDNPVTCERW